MKFKIAPLLAAGFLALAIAPSILADDAGQVTLTGTVVCGKCKLHITKECQNVLQVVDESGTTNNFFLVQNDVSKNFHENICQNDGEKATVTGTINEKHGQEVMTATSIVPAK
jgi:type 1 fimbria pilin